MIAAILAVLITQTYGGQMSVTEGLSDHACAEALCVAKEGMTCEESKQRAEFEAEMRKQSLAEWLVANPKKAAKCKTPQGFISNLDCGPLPSLSSYSHIVNPEEIKIARCAK